MLPHVLVECGLCPAVASTSVAQWCPSDGMGAMESMARMPIVALVVERATARGCTGTPYPERACWAVCLRC